MRGVYYLLFSFSVTFFFTQGILSPGLLARRQFQIRPGEGASGRKIGWGCAARFPKPLLYYWRTALLSGVFWLKNKDGVISQGMMSSHYRIVSTQLVQQSFFPQSREKRTNGLGGKQWLGRAIEGKSKKALLLFYLLAFFKTFHTSRAFRLTLAGVGRK